MATQPDFDQLLAHIARNHFHQLKERGAAALETQNSDSLDFIDAHVDSIKEALREAYSIGFADGADTENDFD